MGLIHKRLREAAFTGVPVLGFGIVVYTVFRRYFRSGREAEVVPTSDQDVAVDRSEKKEESIDKCIVGSTKELSANTTSNSNNNSSSGFVVIKSNISSCYNSCNNDSNSCNNDEAKNSNSNNNSSRSKNGNSSGSSSFSSGSSSPSFVVIELDTSFMSDWDSSEPTGDVKLKNGDDHTDFSRCLPSQDVAVMRSDIDDIVRTEKAHCEIRRKSEEINTRRTEEFEGVSRDRRATCWSLQSMDDFGRLSAASRESWLSHDSSASLVSASDVAEKLNDAWKMTEYTNSGNNNIYGLQTPFPHPHPLPPHPLPSHPHPPPPPKRISNDDSSFLPPDEKVNVGQGQGATPGQLTTRMFDFPSEFCGRLIGKQGRNVAVVKKKSGAEICVRPKVYSSEFQTVYVQGTHQQVYKAVSLIRKKFPEKKFKNVDYNRHLPDTPALSPAIVQLALPLERTKLDVTITNVVSANHVFLHQTTHPTFESLHRLTLDMSRCYDHDPDAPSLPRPPQVGLLCVVQLNGFWCRCLITATNQETEDCQVRLVDYGGYTLVQRSTLKQIRTDFLSIPFQAIECYLANLLPPEGGNEFCPEMKEALHELVGAVGLKAEVLGVQRDGIPHVSLEQHSGDQVTSINRNMVERGWAKWAPMI